MKRAQLGLTFSLSFALVAAMAAAAASAIADEDVMVVDVHKHAAKNAPAPKTAAALPPLLKEVEAKYFKASTLIAEFEESDESAVTHQNKKTSGIIKYKRPGKIYWETLKPDHSLLVGDGIKFWFYTPPFDKDEPGQYWERKASQVQTRFAQTLLSGTFSYNVSTGLMTVKPKSDHEFTIIPKKGTGGSVKEAVLKVDPQTHLIIGVNLVHRGGNKSQIQLSKIELGKPLEDSLFRFTPPPNTERLEE